jgi:hypothetical protein
MKNKTTLQDMNQMLTRNSYRQPTLTQMDFVEKRPPPKPQQPIPSGWQRTVCPTTGDPFYVNGTSGQVVYQYKDMFRRLKKPPKHSQAVTPTDRSIKSVVEKIIPDVAVSSLIYSTPPSMRTSSKYLDGTVTKPIDLDDDEVSLASQALSDLTNSQMPKKKKQKKVFTHSMTPGAVLGEEGWETDDDESDSDISPNLLAD